MDHQLVLSCFGAAFLFLFYRVVQQVDEIRREFKSLSESVQNLNIKIATMMERVEFHDREIRELKNDCNSN